MNGTTAPPPVHIRRLAPGIKKAVLKSTCGPGAGDGVIRAARGHFVTTRRFRPFLLLKATLQGVVLLQSRTCGTRANGGKNPFFRRFCLLVFGKCSPGAHVFVVSSMSLRIVTRGGIAYTRSGREEYRRTRELLLRSRG